MFLSDSVQLEFEVTGKIARALVRPIHPISDYKHALAFIPPPCYLCAVAIGFNNSRAVIHH
jgi:hypothetical protein